MEKKFLHNLKVPKKILAQPKGKKKNSLQDKIAQPPHPSPQKYNGPSLIQLISVWKWVLGGGGGKAMGI